MKLIVTADWHLRADRPRCRTDIDWIGHQEYVLTQIADIANEEGASVAIVGDIFDTPKVAQRIEVMFLDFCDKVRNNVYVIAGNHDLPYHSWKNVDNSSFGVIWKSGKVKHLNEIGVAAHFGEEERSYISSGLVFKHILTFPDKESMPPNVNAISAEELAYKYSAFQYIFTGDYHHNFHSIINYDDKYDVNICNPGCITRQTADYKNYMTSVIEYNCSSDIEDGMIIFHELDDGGDNVITDEYLREAENREDRISAFVDAIKIKGEISLDFKKNIDFELRSVDFDKSLRDIILEFMEVE